jgi:N-glycosylase/DNA lyase
MRVASSLSQNNIINVESSINSGQVFLWQRTDTTNHNNHVWYGINGENIIRITTNYNTNKVQIRCINNPKKRIDFFRSSDNYAKILRDISKDETIKHAIRQFPGLRILRQDPFQCLISFIVSSNSSIQNIKRSLHKLCMQFGDRYEFDNREFFVFPKPQKLAKARNDQLAKCGLGYRTKFVKCAAQNVLDGDIDLEKLASKKNDYHTAKSSLLEMIGIGDKVADCILLFSLERLDAFPLDRWMMRILEKYYSDTFSFEGKSLTTKKYQDIHKRVVDYFGPNAGYAQQFLFKMERENNQKRWL